jgi:capsular exopolysaccharide synthesis family protein
MIVAIGFIAVTELMNGKVLYRFELEKFTSFPILGELAYQKGADSIVIQKGKRTFIAEEFRRLRVSLPFLGIGPDAKKILVTSSIPGEGKSFISSNLAVSLSLTGKKVVLLDFDLNNPSLGHMFNKHEHPGVSNYLTGELPLEEIISKVPDYPNLFFIASGTLPDNPSELISSGRVKQLIDALENSFDFVVMDTAPVVPVTDAYLLSGYCNATLYVVRHKYTPKRMIKRLDENNKINTLTNPAIVFNGVKPRGFLSKNYGYGYGYGYVHDYKPSDKKTIKSIA